MKEGTSALKAVEEKEVEDVRKLEAQAEHIFGEAFTRIEDIDVRLEKIEESCAMLPEIKLLLSNISTAQSVMAESSKLSAQSARDMAHTYQEAEKRQEEQRKEYSALVALAVGKNQVPYETHRASIKAAIWCGITPACLISFCVVVGVLYWTGTNLDASLTNIQLNQAKATLKMETVEKKVAEVVSDADHDSKEKTKGP